MPPGKIHSIIKKSLPTAKTALAGLSRLAKTGFYRLLKFGKRKPVKLVEGKTYYLTDDGTLHVTKPNRDFRAVLFENNQFSFSVQERKATTLEREQLESLNRLVKDLK